MAKVMRISEPKITAMCVRREWSANIDIGDGITLPTSIATYAEGAEYADRVDLYDAKNGVTLYGYVLESNREGYALVMVNSMTPEGRYDVIPPKVYVKGGGT